MLLYMQDIIDTAPHLANVVSNALLNYAVYPILISSVCSTKHKPVISVNTALFLLHQTCAAITYAPALEAIASCILLPFQPKQVLQVVEEPPPAVPGYGFNWVPVVRAKYASLNNCILACRDSR